MRNLVTKLLSLVIIAALSSPAFAQEEGDFRTKASGDWSDPQIWETYSGGSWTATANPPDGSEIITVVATEERNDSVFVDVATTITGRLIHQGTIATQGDLAVGDGGFYQYDRDGTEDSEEGSLPIVTWEEGSTLEMTGVEAVAPENRNQNYHNITFNTPDLLANLNMDMDSITVAGDIRVIDTGLARWYLTSTSANDTNLVTIQGDVIVEGGAFSVQGTSNANTTFIVHHYGNIDVTGGNFSVSRGSQGLGTTTWHLFEGDFSMDNATTQSSTITPEGAAFRFEKEGTQVLALGENIEFSALPIEVSGATTLEMGSSKLAGAGHFLLEEGGMITTTLPGGIAEIFADVTAAVTLEGNSSYGFDGTEAQVTSEMMPTVIENLTISNPAGVTLSQETTINGVLLLDEGVFDNSIPFTLGAEATIVEEGGSLQVPTAAEDDELPQTFYVEQNFPNPFNPSTVIRYALPQGAEVTFAVYNMLGQEVRAWSEGFKSAGVHEYTFDARNLSSGMYIYHVTAGEFEATKQMVLVE